MSNPETNESEQVQLGPKEVDALRQKLTKEYEARGLFTKVFEDAPDEHSTPHAHEGATLVTLTGSAQVRLDEGEWQQVTPGTITTIADDQLHEVITGPDGWSYLFACSQQEAQRQGLLD